MTANAVSVVETIGGSIIETHLRLTDQWPELYGHGWADALVGLYSRGEWIFADRDRRDGFSVVLFGRAGGRWRHPPRESVAEVLAMPGVSSVQVTFHEDRDPALHAMPPGGFRLAIINCWNLETGLDARARLSGTFRRALAARRIVAATGVSNSPAAGAQAKSGTESRAYVG